MTYLGATELIYPAGVSIGTNTLPLTLNNVGEFIVEIEGQIDGYLAGAGYEIPIATGASYAYAAIRKATRDGVMGVVLNTLFPNLSNVADKTTSLASSYAKAYADFLASLKTGKLILVGAAKAGEDEGRVLPRGGGLASMRVDMNTRF